MLRWVVTCIGGVRRRRPIAVRATRESKRSDALPCGGAAHRFLQSDRSGAYPSNTTLPRQATPGLGTAPFRPWLTYRP